MSLSGLPRRATRGDLAQILELEATFPGDRLSRRSLVRLLARPSAELWVLDIDGQIIGDIVLLFKEKTTVARVYSVVVREDLRGQGIGLRLYELASARARARGYRFIGCEVRSDNLAGQRVPLKLGYRLIGEIPAYYADGSTAVRLRLDLDADITPGT